MENNKDEVERELEAAKRRFNRKRQIQDITQAFDKKRFSGETRAVRDIVDKAHAALEVYDMMETPPAFADVISKLFDDAISRFAELADDAQSKD